MKPVRPIALSELPAPPPDRTGWPWTEASPPLPAKAPCGVSWPRISIVTPSFNQGIYLEETIRSVLLQGYPNLEYHIMDGGSTDGSVAIIRKYGDWLAGWVSEKDHGQSDAINKGFARSDGEIFNWLCSDDFLTKDAIASVGREFSGDDGCDVLAGACFCQYDDEPERSRARSAWVDGWTKTPYHAAIWQPSCYFRRSLVERSELVRTDLHYCMDRELWCYFFRRNARWKWTEDTLSHYRYTGANKSTTGKQKIIDEIARIYMEHVPERIPLPPLIRNVWLPLVLASMERKPGFGKVTVRGLSRGVARGLLATYPREHVRALQREFYEYSVW